MQGEEERQIGVVRIEQVEVPEIEGVVAGDRSQERVQQVVAFIEELGIVNAEDFVKVGRRAFDGGKVAVVDDDREGEKTEVVAVQLDFLDSLPQFPDLRLLGVVEQRVLRRGVVQIDLAEEGTFRVVEVPALRLNRTAGLARLFFLPFGDDVVVGADVEEAFEQQGERMSGRLLQREDLDVVFVQTEIAAMAFKMGFAEVVIEERVVLQLRSRELLRIKIQRALQNRERFLFPEDSRAHEVADVRPEAFHLLAKDGLGPFDLALVETHTCCG